MKVVAGDDIILQNHTPPFACIHQPLPGLKMVEPAANLTNVPTDGISTYLISQDIGHLVALGVGNYRDRDH
jgi:hypothetical protein